MHVEGLRVDYIRFSFGLKEITYIGYVITQEEIKPDLKKVKGITYIGRSTTRTEAREIIGMVHYYRYMWPRQSHILVSLTEVASVPKYRKITWNDALEYYFKEINCMVSAETLLSYSDYTIPFTVQNYAYD